MGFHMALASSLRDAGSFTSNPALRRLLKLNSALTGWSENNGGLQPSVSSLPRFVEPPLLRAACGNKSGLRPEDSRGRLSPHSLKFLLSIFALLWYEVALRRLVICRGLWQIVLLAGGRSGLASGARGGFPLPRSGSAYRILVPSANLLSPGGWGGTALCLWLRFQLLLR